MLLQRFLLNPAAFSEDHIVQFRFLGILMAVAVRTKKPLDLHLAPWVWKQLCSMPLGGADLEEVDLLTYRTLQGILHLENSGITEDNFHVVRCLTICPNLEFSNDSRSSFKAERCITLFPNAFLPLPLLPYLHRRWSHWIHLWPTVQMEGWSLLFLEVKTSPWPLLTGQNMWRGLWTTDCMKWIHRFERTDCKGYNNVI